MWFKNSEQPFVIGSFTLFLRAFVVQNYEQPFRHQVTKKNGHRDHTDDHRWETTQAVSTCTVIVLSRFVSNSISGYSVSTLETWIGLLPTIRNIRRYLIPGGTINDTFDGWLGLARQEVSTSFTVGDAHPPVAIAVHYAATRLR